ncbi:hypothetical protein Y032_0589g363 [Ancylostoma ceylanicum]|uniref:Reverse transcriptase domain-containing protein n=1 Tax=Ancylostoma ceylanicum TaxID=53326 RepID=A0A016WNS8_9BILA|nr:hypothetical protein Y032_0589g363 [Ancylostoma ceylanicum]
MEDNPQTTLKELSAEIQQFMDIRQDAKLLGNQPSSPLSGINAVNAKKNHGTRLHPASDVEDRIGPRTATSPTRRSTTANVSANKAATVASTTAHVTPVSRIYRQVKISGITVRLRLDTGAGGTLLSHKDWIAIGRQKLLPPLFLLKSVNNKDINVRGHFNCNFNIDGHEGRGNCHVADTTPLLGLDWIAQVKPLFRRPTEGAINVFASLLNNLCASLTKQLQKHFAAVFASGLGRRVKSETHLTIKPDAEPVFRKARPARYAALPRNSQEIDRMVADDVLSPNDHSDWAPPIAVVQKKNRSIGLCADYSTGLSDALEQHHHPLPPPDDILAKLNRGRYFSQLGLAEAYLQLEMDEDSRPLLTINTHRGLYRLNRLPFGVKPAPGIFQQHIDAPIAGLHGAAAYLDNIIVTDRTIDENNTRLNAVFQTIHDDGFRVRLEKCAFLRLKSTTWVSSSTLKDAVPTPRRSQQSTRCHIQKTSAVSQLRAFLGLVNFHGTFVKDLHNFRAPLDALTKKDAVYVSAKLLSIASRQRSNRIYSQRTSIQICQSSSQQTPLTMGLEQSYHTASRTDPRRSYTIRAVPSLLRSRNTVRLKRRHLLPSSPCRSSSPGRRFTLKTDHKPLLAILGSKKGVPVYSANRLQRWATTLLNYNFTIAYVNTKDFGQADGAVTSHPNTAVRAKRLCDRRRRCRCRRRVNGQLQPFSSLCRNYPDCHSR